MRSLVKEEGHQQFSCSLCGKASSLRHNIYQHIRSKHLGVKYACPYCTFSTSWSNHLKKHLKSVHHTQ